jgi:5'-nucleotidase
VRILITNDDGIESAGIRTLAAVAAECGHEVLVAAPAWDSSGASASLTGVSADGRLMVEEVTLDVPGTRCIAVQSAPALIVRAGLRGAFGAEPDMVLSGINLGANTGHAVLHSGTVGAALTASTHGCRAVAFSLGGGTRHLDTAGDVARCVLEWVVDAPAPMVLNVNVPDVPMSELRGLRDAPLASFGAVQTHVTEIGAGYVDLLFEEIDPSGEPESDAGLLRQGWATITPLQPVCEATDIDTGGMIDLVSGLTRSGSRR